MKEKWGVPRVHVPEKWNGCLLVNPLCPEDLCWLPAANGHQHMWHCLGTDPWDHRFTLGGTAFFMSKTATNTHDLWMEGFRAQLLAFPDELAFRRLTNPELVREALGEPPSRWPTWPAR
jgi:hypothetical protein